MTWTLRPATACPAAASAPADGTERREVFGVLRQAGQVLVRHLAQALFQGLDGRQQALVLGQVRGARLLQEPAHPAGDGTHRDLRAGSTPVSTPRVAATVPVAAPRAAERRCDSTHDTLGGLRVALSGLSRPAAGAARPG